VAFDEALAQRVREQLAGTDFTEKRMFGGLAFLVRGHMAVAVSGSAAGGALMVRVTRDDTDRLLDEPFTGPVAMRGRPMAGWRRVHADGVGTASELAPWARSGAEHARSLPRK
jgi:TfoX/Sxy family transcriptional regulator of competence genes